MAEVRFKVDDDLHSDLLEFQQLAAFDSLGSAARSITALYVRSTIAAIRNGQDAIAAGGKDLQPSAPPPAAPPPLGGFSPVFKRA